MDQSFDFGMISLNDAADLVAIRARLGVSRSMREKQAMNPALTGALVGGGLGLGTGLLSTLMSKRKEKQWMRNALLGSLLGAGVGGAAGYGMSQLPTAAGKNSTSDLLARQKAIIEQATGGTGEGESFWNTGMLTDALFNRVSSDFDPNTITAPALRQEYLANQQQLTGQGVDQSQAGVKKPGSGITNMVGNLPLAGELGAGGFGAGDIVDRLREYRANNANQQVGPKEIAQSARQQGNHKAYNESVGKPLAEQIRSSVPYRERVNQKQTPAQMPLPRGGSLPLPQFNIPFTGQVREGFRGETTPGSGTMRDIAVSPPQMEVLRDTAKANREISPAKRGRGGKGWGTAIGVLSGLFAPKAQHPDVNP